MALPTALRCLTELPAAKPSLLAVYRHSTRLFTRFTPVPHGETPSFCIRPTTLPAELPTRRTNSKHDRSAPASVPSAARPQLRVDPADFPCYTY